MCKDCVIDPYPNRNKTCLESGSYLINFKGTSYFLYLHYTNTQKILKRILFFHHSLSVFLLYIERQKAKSQKQDKKKIKNVLCDPTLHLITIHMSIRTNQMKVKYRNQFLV